MNTRNDFLSISFAFLSAALIGLLSSPAVANPAGPGPQSDPAMTADLAELASVFGDSAGNIYIIDEGGDTKVLAQDLGGYTPYTGGDQVYVDDTFAMCSEDRFGGLDSCVEVGPGTPGELDDYDCTYVTDNDGW